ncbi:MAG: ABC transporter permease [Candidatus Aminicenantes bacterium]|nr:ABC transporter permease [Candidatus Aminicenantes bacterium]MDH5704660.1 ABC transporter permease [Candidatus Aminicenantes bacterium]
MRKILSVIKREYIQIVRTKGFIIGTILGPVLMAAILVVPIVVASMTVEKQETIGVADLSREIFLDLDKKLGEKEYMLKDGFRRYVLKKFERPPVGSIDELKKELNAKVLNKELSAYILIPEHVLGDEAAVSAVQEAGSRDNDVEYVSQHTSDFEKLGSLNNALNSVIIEKRLKREGLDPEKISQFIQRVRLKPIKVTKKGEEEDTMGTFMVSYFLALIIYMAIFIYGSVIMRGVIEEKSSRVIEVILSSMRPFQLMLGKILGIGAVGLTQFSVWAVFGLAATSYSKSFIPAGAEISLVSIPTYVFIYFVVFFILGYFLYATFYAAVGSLVNSEKEAQQLVMPITMFLILPLLLLIFVIRSPDSGLSVFLSLFPLFTPIIMMLRIAVLLPPFVQIGASIVLLILTVLLMTWLAAKIYRVGVLMYGKPPKFAEIVRWIRYK